MSACSMMIRAMACMQGSVVRALVRAYWRESLVCGMMMLLDVIVQLGSPLLLQQLLLAVRQGRSQGIAT